MAVKQLDLVINTTRAEQNLKKIQQLAKQVEDQFQQKINKIKINVKIDPAQKALDKFTEELKKGKQLLQDFSSGQGLNVLGSKISEVTENASLLRKVLNDGTTAIERKRAATAVLAADFKKLTMEATAFATATDSRGKRVSMIGNVGETIKEIEKFPKTILAGKNALNILNNMLEVTNVKSKDFEQITDAISKQLQKNAEIEEKIPKFISKKNEKQKKQNDLEKENNKFKKRKNALNEQTENIENRIKNSIISKAKKEELINNLKRVGVKIEQKELDLARQINIETQRNLTMEEKIQGRKNRIAQSAFIGGGFPLLFGASPAQAIGGALGGGIGEAYSPGGGFAGSIAVTAAVNAVQQVFTSTIELSKALKTTSGTMDLMSERTLFSSDAIEKQAKALQDQGKEAELAALLTDELTKALGPGGLGNLDKLATQSREMARQFGILKTNMELFIAGPLTHLISILNKVLGRKNLFSNIDENLKQVKADLGLEEFNKRMAEIQKFMTTGEKFNSIMNPAPLGLGDVGGTPITAGMNISGVEDLSRLAEIEKISRRGLKPSTLPFQSNLETTNGPSSSTKDFSQFEIDILTQRIALQKTSGSLLDEEVVKIKKGIIESEKLLALEKVGNSEKGKKIANLNATIKLNELDKNIEAAKLKDEKELEKFLEGEIKNLEQLEAKEKALADAEVKRINKIKESANSVTKNLEQQNELNTIKLTGSEYEIALAEATIAFTKDQLALFDEEAFKIAFNNKLRIDGLMEQKKITEDIKNLLATEMSTAIKGLITGANSLNDAFRNVLNKMADAFLNIGLFGNVAGDLTKGKGLLGNLFGGLLATGGTAKAGKSYIVGERGPEMFTPGVTGTVTPNHALGGSTNVVVNVDASGSSVEGDEQQGRELGRLISVAVQSEIANQQRPGGLLFR